MQFKIPFTNIFIGSGGDGGVRYGKSVGTNAPFGKIIGELTGKRFSAESMFTAYRDNSDIYGCVREWSQNVGVGGLSIEDVQHEENTVPKQVQNQIYSILNYYTTFRALKNNTVRDFGVTGNAYWEVVYNASGTNIVAVCRLDPRTIRIITDPYGTVIKYLQVTTGNVVEFDPDSIIHFKLDCDPDNEVFGFSPIEPIFWEAKTDESAKKTNYYFFENKASPGVWYILEPTLSKDAKQQLTDEIKAQLKGSTNTNKGAVLDGVKEIKSFDITSKDMEYLLGRKYITEKICSSYGVPSFLLGYTENTNYNNGKELMKKFYEGTIQPIEELFIETLNRVLMKLLGYENKYELEFNPMTFNEKADIEARALTEFNNGAITLRQYKQKTGQTIFPADEQQVNFDAYILKGGSSAVLLEDVGVQPVFDPNNTNQTQNIVNAITKKYDTSKL